MFEPLSAGPIPFGAMGAAAMRLHHIWTSITLAALCAAAPLQIAAAATYQMTIKSTPEAGSKCVSTPAGPFVEGMRVFIWDCGPQLAQNLVYDDQTQQLKFGANCVEVLGQGNPQDAIGVGSCNGAVTQRWSMMATRDVYQIVGVNGLCLDISNGVIANGTPLDLVKCAASNAIQIWVLFQAADMTNVAAAPSSTGAAGDRAPGHIRSARAGRHLCRRLCKGSERYQSVHLAPRARCCARGTRSIEKSGGARLCRFGGFCRRGGRERCRYEYGDHGNHHPATQRPAHATGDARRWQPHPAHAVGRLKRPKCRTKQYCCRQDHWRRH